MNEQDNNEVEFNDELKRKLLFSYAGAIIGFFIVKAFIFNVIEDMGWAFFWDAVFKGNISFDGLLKIVTTSGFIKLAIGTALGWKLGEWYENGTIKKFIDDINSDDEDKGGKE